MPTSTSLTTRNANKQHTGTTALIAGVSRGHAANITGTVKHWEVGVVADYAPHAVTGMRQLWSVHCSWHWPEAQKKLRLFSERLKSYAEAHFEINEGVGKHSTNYTWNSHYGLAGRGFNNRCQNSLVLVFIVKCLQMCWFMFCPCTDDVCLHRIVAGGPQTGLAF